MRMRPQTFDAGNAPRLIAPRMDFSETPMISATSATE